MCVRATFKPQGFSFTLHGPAIFFEPNEWHLGTKLETAAFCATISNFARSQACLFSPSEVWPRIRIVHCGVDGAEPADTTASDGPCQLLFVGRLDAVNVFEPDCSIVTSIAMDHMDYLGDTREAIGFEKAGIFRPGKPAICGDPVPPESLLAHAEAIGARLQVSGPRWTFTQRVGGWKRSR